MIRKLTTVLIVTLALNFLAGAGAVGWLFYSGKLDKDKFKSIKEIVFIPEIAEVPSTQPTTAPAADPLMKLDELLAERVGRPATEQIQFLQGAFDARLLMLERRQRELLDLQQQIELAKQKLSRDRDALTTERADLQAREEQEVTRASDEGFQDALAVYNSMPSKQVKSVFMSLDDATVVQFLQAMQPRTAARIVKEFKTPAEAARVQMIMERLRQAGADASAKE